MRVLFIKYLIFFCAVLVGVKNTKAQGNFSFQVENYSPVDFNSHNQNWIVKQSEDGKLYFANGDGLLYYNGSSWEKYITTYATTILSLDINSKGIIYTGGINEIGYFYPNTLGKLTHYSYNKLIPDSLKSFGNIWNTYAINKTIFYQGDKDVFIIKNNKLIKHIAAQNDFTTSFQVNNNFWIHDLKVGLFILDSLGNKQKLINTDYFNNLSIYEILPYSKSSVLIITAKNGLFVYNVNNGNVSKLNIQDKQLSASKIFCATALKSGDFALGTMYNGLYVINRNGDVLDTFTTKNGIFSGKINYVFEDREGNLWCAMNKGISKIIYGMPYKVLKEGTVYKGIVNTIIEYNNQIFVGTNEGVFNISKTTENNIVKYQTFDLLKANNELIIASTDGVYLYKSGNIEMILNGYSRALSYDDSLKILLVGCRDKIKLLKKQNNKWVFVWSKSFKDEVLNIEKQSVDNDSLTFWLGLFSEGVCKLKLNKHDYNTTAYFYSENVGFKPGYVIPYKVNNSIVFASKFQDIYNYNPSNNDFEINEQFSKFLGTDTASYILKSDLQQNVFLDASGPVFLLRKSKQGYRLDKKSLSKMELGYLNDLYTDENNITWLGYESGVVKFNPSINKNFNLDYNVVINKININSDSTLFYGHYGDSSSIYTTQKNVPVLSYEYNNIDFEFSATYYAGNNHLKYSYVLEGNNDNFSTWKKENKAVYTNLYEGDYTFKVKALNKYNKISKTASYSFKILPPWYRTWWAYLLYFLGLVVVVIIILRLNSRRLKKANKKLQEIIEENTAEIKNQRDELLNQKTELETKNKEITDSIVYAERIQRALLGAENHENKNFPEHFIFFKPKDIVSGDFYWGVEKKNDSEHYLYIAAVDCTGHGVPGAFMSLLGISFLNEITASNEIYTPAEILDKLREKVIVELSQKGKEGDTKDGMDISFLRINVLDLKAQDKKTVEIQWAGANNPLYHIKKLDTSITEKDVKNSIKYVKVITADKQAIGYDYKMKPFTNNLIQIEKGDELVLFTDGFADQFGGEKGKKYKYKTFKKFLLEIHSFPADIQKQKLEQEFNNWKGNFEQIDDVCVIGIKF